ncbi:MAG: shikimate kinase [Flavobacteriales bacterium]|nr:shikimate kinase [Flavobacteriales bacterium]
MGSGKTTLGKKLANKLGYAFFDLDELIEEQEKLSISEIFSKQGENYFRTVEQKILNDKLVTNQPLVLSVGGGTPCFFDNMEFINKQATSIYLKYNAGMLYSRLSSAKAKRPLLTEKSDEELKDFIKKTLSEREGFYNQSKIVVESNNITVDTIFHQLDLK